MSTSSIIHDPAWRGDAPIPGEVTTSQDIKSGWPRMLKLDEATEVRLVNYLDNEIFLMWSERNLVTADWIQWQKDYWSKPSSTTKNFPFRRAANIVIPMTAIAVEAVYARLMTTLFSVKPFFSIRPRIKDWVDASPKVESWLQTEVEDPNSLDVAQFARESLLELIKLGTGIGKSGYERDIRKTNIDVPGGGTTSNWITRRDGATLDYVPLANFLMRFHEKDPQTATLVGEEHREVTWAQLKRMGLSGRMIPESIKKIGNWFTQSGDIESQGTEYDQARREEEHDEPGWKETFSFTEIWLSFDVDGDGVDEEIVVDFHKESRTVLSIRYNWYADAHRPYRIGVYIPVEGRWTGIGVGKQLEQFQALITTVHRQRLDAGTLANMGQLAVKKNSGYTSDEPMWPGKMWFVDNPATDIREFSLSNTQHFAQLSNEDAARNYADKRSGANELILGTPKAGTPATATTDMMKLQEGNKKFDMVLKNVRRWYSLLGSDVLANFQQFGTRERSWIVQGENGQYIEDFLSMPQADVRRGAFVDLSVTDSITNKDVEAQKWMQLFGLLTAHYDKVLERAGQVSGLLQDPQIFLMFAEMTLRGSNEAMERLLGAFAVPDISSFLIDLSGPGGGDVGPEGSRTDVSGPGGGGQSMLTAPGFQGTVATFGTPSNSNQQGGNISIDEG